MSGLSEAFRAARTIDFEWRKMGFQLLLPSQYELHMRFTTRPEEERDKIIFHRCDAMAALIGWDERVTYKKFYGPEASADPIPFSQEAVAEIVDADLAFLIEIVALVHEKAREIKKTLDADEKN